MEKFRKTFRVYKGAKLNVWSNDGVTITIRGDVHKQSSFPFMEKYLYLFDRKEDIEKLRPLAKIIEFKSDNIEAVMAEIKRIGLNECKENIW